DTTAVDNNPIRGWLRFDAQSNQTIGHDLNAVGFLDPQLFSAAQYRTPFGHSRRDEQHRKLINSQRHQVFRNIDAFQLSAAHTNVRHRLTAHFTLVFQGNVAAHQLKDIDDTGAGRIDAD